MDKPFLSFEQQIDKLITDYKLNIADREFATLALSTISYYDLINGYKSLFMDNDIFFEGVTMEFLFSTHMYNKGIQGVIFKYSMYAENSFKTILAYIIAETFGVHSDDYLKNTNYKLPKDTRTKERLKSMLEKLKETCEKCSDTPTRHYRLTKDHIPPWILFRNISFSDASNIFDFLKSDDKERLLSYFTEFQVAEIELQEKVRTMQSALTIVRKFRNQIAHNLTFVDYRCVELRTAANILFQGTLINQNEVKVARNDLWALIMSIILLLNNNYLIKNFLAELNSYMVSFPEVIEIYCHFAGIPNDFEQRIINYLGI